MTNPKTPLHPAREALRKAGVKVQDVAAEAGLSPWTVSRALWGHVRPSERLVVVMERLTGLPREQLFPGASVRSPADTWVIAMLLRSDCPAMPGPDADEESIDRARMRFAVWATKADPEGAARYASALR